MRKNGDWSWARICEEPDVTDEEGGEVVELGVWVWDRRPVSEPGLTWRGGGGHGLGARVSSSEASGSG